MMNRRLFIAAGLAVLLSFAAGYCVRYFQIEESGLRAAKESKRQTVSGTLPTDPQFKRGHELARKHCAACHLFPDPNLLTRSEWVHHVLPQMAQRLGVEPVNYEGMQDGKILREANLYPTSPSLSEDDWFAIWNYYTAAAPSRPLPPAAKPKVRVGLENFRVRKMNFHGGVPMTSLVQIDSPQHRLYVGDSYAGILATVDAAGKTLSTVRLGGAPVGLTVRGAGFYATLIGRMFPSDTMEGSLVFVPGNRESPPLAVLDKLRRPTDATFADLNQDGREDLVVCSFGNQLGRFSWFEAKADGQYEEHVLLDRPGAVRSQIYDFNKDGRPDIIVLMAQAREGLYIFYNQGNGQFKMETVIEQPPSFGYAYFELMDFNRDGFMDILTVNGDSGDIPTPHKNYHGIRIYLNDGKSHFTEAWFYPMEGAYKARAVDFDLDGDLDIAAISFFPDFTQTPVESFVYLENKGGFRFDAHTLAESSAGRWLTMDAGDLDGDGDADIVLGSFVAGPTTIAVPPSVRENWKTNGAAVLLLENLKRP